MDGQLYRRGWQNAKGVFTTFNGWLERGNLAKCSFFSFAPVQIPSPCAAMKWRDCAEMTLLSRCVNAQGLRSN